MMASSRALNDRNRLRLSGSFYARQDFRKDKSGPFCNRYACHGPPPPPLIKVHNNPSKPSRYLNENFTVRHSVSQGALARF